MDRQATQPAAVPSGRKRRRVSSKKPKGETPASDMIGLSPGEALDVKATQPPTSELVLALKALPKAEDPLTPPPPHTLSRLFRPRADGGNPERL